MLTYLELCQDRCGSKDTATAQITELDFAMIVTLLSTEKSYDDALELIENDEDEDCAVLKSNGTLFAFDSFITGEWQSRVKDRATYLKKVVKSLDKKGYFADMWEEGSYAICRDGFKKDAINAIARIEAQVDKDSWNF